MNEWRVAVYARLLVDVEADTEEEAMRRAAELVRSEGDLEGYWTEDVWAEKDPLPLSEPEAV